MKALARPKRFTAPVAGRITLDVSAGTLWLKVTADPAVTTATVEITGPDEITDEIRTSLSGSTWALSFPRSRGHGGITFGGGGVTTVINSGTQNIMMSGGRIVVNGVDVTSAVAAGTPEPLRARVRLPVASSLIARVESGGVVTSGGLASVTADSTSADLDIGVAGTARLSAISGDVRVGILTGQANLNATSGDISVEDARGPVTANATSGDVRVHATSPVTVDARSVSGDVRVTGTPDAHARSVSGRVRTS